MLVVLLVLDTEFYVGFAFSSANQKAKKQTVTPIFEIVSVSQSWPFFPARERAARDDASNFHYSFCKSWALQAFAGDGAGSGACAVSQRGENDDKLPIFAHFSTFFGTFSVSPKNRGFYLPIPCCYPVSSLSSRIDVPTCTPDSWCQNSYRYYGAKRLKAQRNLYFGFPSAIYISAQSGILACSNGCLLYTSDAADE